MDTGKTRLLATDMDGFIAELRLQLPKDRIIRWTIRKDFFYAGVFRSLPVPHLLWLGTPDGDHSKMSDQLGAYCDECNLTPSSSVWETFEDYGLGGQTWTHSNEEREHASV